MSIDVSGVGTPLSERAAEEILSVMGRRRMSRAELARRLGVSAMWVSYRLNGQQEIGLNDLQRIAGVLGVEPVDLLPRGANLSAGPNLTKKRPPNRPQKTHPKGRADFGSAVRRTSQKRALTTEELDLIRSQDPSYA